LSYNRYTLSKSDNVILYVDVVEIKEQDWYAVGTVCLHTAGDGCPDFANVSYYDVIQPVRSKVMEWIFFNNSSLYSDLAKEKIVPTCSLSFHSTFNHFKTDPVLDVLCSRYVERRIEQEKRRCEKYDLPVPLFNEYLSSFREDFTTLREYYSVATASEDRAIMPSDSKKKSEIKETEKKNEMKVVRNSSLEGFRPPFVRGK